MDSWRWLAGLGGLAVLARFARSLWRFVRDLGAAKLEAEFSAARIRRLRQEIADLNEELTRLRSNLDGGNGSSASVRAPMTPIETPLLGRSGKHGAKSGGSKPS